MAVNSITSSDIIFTNSMRRTLNNTQFFGPNGDSQNTRNSDSNSSTENNILWINLTSDNGVFSQAAIGYTSNATDDDDGWGYDTPRNLSLGPMLPFIVLLSLLIEILLFKEKAQKV